MIKYKLIKEYPGSHPKGSVSKLDYSNYPEFWQKLEELDYEILGFFNKMNKRVYHFDKASKSFCSIDGFHNNVNYEYCLKYYVITSVKRLSDGEVFTVGDEATIESDEKRYKIIKIRKFTNAIQIHGEIEGRAFFYNLNDVIKLQPINPLFTTEDGVAIFLGDSYWIVSGDNVIDITSALIRTESTLRGAFSSKEKAFEYVLYNKPCLSIKEIGSHIPEGTLLRLLETVKSKL